MVGRSSVFSTFVGQLLSVRIDMMPRMSKIAVGMCFLCVAALVAAFILGGLLASPRYPSSPALELHTHEEYVKNVLQRNSLPLDPQQVFADILNSLPDRVDVYPTENYYYFYFFRNGIRYAGNIRLSVWDRDQGKLHFSYYEDATPWSEAVEITYLVLDQSSGVHVERLGSLSYRVKYGNKNVTFTLNNLAAIQPPVGTLNRDEFFVGPIFDDSAISFFLIFNKALKQFYYILNEDNLPEKLVRSSTSGRILIGQRTGFAFYHDDKLERKILIGVFAENADTNNYFDGPFDQLPDNFIRGDEFRDMILLVAPDLKGKIDRFGIFSNGEMRYVIAPYMFYNKISDLDIFAKCANNSKVSLSQYYNCFIIDDDSRTSSPRPLALNK